MRNERALAAILSEFARTMVTDFPIQGILDQLVLRIVEVLPITAAGVTIISADRKPHYVAASNRSALQFERLQTDLGEGPCLLAYETGEAVAISDLRAEDRFPTFGPPALAEGLAAVFTFPLRKLDGQLGALDLYRDAPGELSASAMTVAQTLADVVAAYLLNAQSRVDLQDSVDASIDRALHDALTGLPNRAQGMDRLAIALTRTAQAGDLLAVLFCDLDSFKVVNDSIGHEGGDRVLIEVARRLQHVLRHADTVARTGGDEFLVICEGLTDVAGATAIAEHIRRVVEQPVAFEDFEAAVSVSIGIVTVAGFEAGTAAPMTLLRNADAAMYRAKGEGKARWALFDESLISAATHRRELEPELRRALAADEFVLHYQPVYDLNDDGIVGVEALVRWNSPNRGFQQPHDFIGLAEETGLIVPIGLWVLREACEQMRHWNHDLDWPGWMAVNLSARQLAEPGLVSTIEDLLVTTDLEPALLRLELTETALLRVGHASTLELETIRGLGVHVGMDDFGTGYASLTNLQQLPIDFLKIDQSFVVTLRRGGDQSDCGNAIVNAITQIGQTLELETIAEGIETDEQADLLREFGCPYGQGYRFARPAPAAQIAELLAGGTRPPGMRAAAR